MPNKKLEDYGDYDIIPASEIFAELRKSPSYMREYEALEEEFAEHDRQIERRIARREWRAAQLARVRHFWCWLTRGVDQVATNPQP